MGDVVSSHLDESRRENITARTRDVMKQFGDVYEQQYAVALFNGVRLEIEGGGRPQSQLLHRKDPLAGRSIFSGSLFQYLEENRKWRNRFISVPNSYTISFYESKTAHERGLHPKGTINCAGYKALSSIEEYMELMGASLPGVKAKMASGPFIKCATPFPLILWHPYSRHHYFCVMTEKEQKKWLAVLQDCVRHSNNGLPEDNSVETPAFTDAVRRYRQDQGHYGTWDMMCGNPPQILANLVMETLHPQLRDAIAPRLKGKMQQRQRNWMLISDAVYRQVLSQTSSQFNALLEACQVQRVQLDTRLRTDMDQIITSKEHVSGKIRAVVLPKAEQLLRSSVQPYISSILEALMEPTSRGFSEVRDVFFKELVEISKNSLNGGGKEKLGENLERLSMLAFHPVKMQSCYEKVEQLNLEGLQQRFDVSSPAVFISRAQILMGEQMDNSVYTFEQLLQQSLDSSGSDDLCKVIQRCQDRVLKKYDYDSSTVRKKFFREALLQITIPYMLQHLRPSCSPELPRFKELIFEDFSRFLPVENLFEEVVLHSVSKDIMMAVKEAAVQRRHNLYRDSIVLTNSDPNLHLLEDQPQVDWAAKFGADDVDGSVDGSEGGGGGGDGGGASKRRRQVVSMIQLDGLPLPYESCMEVPGVELIPEEEVSREEEEEEEEQAAAQDPKSPDSVNEIRDLINPVVEMVVPVAREDDGVATLFTSSGDEVVTKQTSSSEGVATHPTSVGDGVVAQPIPSSEMVASQTTPAGDEVATQPTTAGDEVATQPTTAGDEVATQPTPAGDEVAAQPTPAGDEVATQLTFAGNEVPTLSTPPSEEVASQPTPSSEEVKTQPTPAGDAVVTQPTPALDEVVTQPTPAGDEDPTQPTLETNGVGTQPTPAGNGVKVKQDAPSRNSQRERSSAQSILQELKANKRQEKQEEEEQQEALEEMKVAVQEAEVELTVEASAAAATDSSPGGDSGFQSPSVEGLDEEQPEPGQNTEVEAILV